MVLTDKNIGPIKAILREALLAEWSAQGHFESGKVVEEIDYLIEREFGRVSVVGMMYPFGIYIDRGVDAGNIPFSPGSGKKKSKYIDGLINFVQRRMAIADLKEAKSVAFAIAHTQKKEGMPTRGSFSFSSTGKRTEWVSEAIRNSSAKLGAYIRQFYREYMTAEFESVITKNIKKL